MSEEAVSIEECHLHFLPECGELSKKLPCQKCRKLFLEYHSKNCRAFIHVSYDDDVKADSSRWNNLISRCIFEQNSYVCSFLEHLDKGLLQESHSSSSSQQDKMENICKKSCAAVIVLCESFDRLLQGMSGWTVSEDYVGVELVVLHNYLVIYLNRLLIDLLEWPRSEGLQMVCIVLRRAFKAMTGYIMSSYHQKPYEKEIFPLLDGIFYHTEDMAELTLGALSAVCYSLFFVLFACNVFVPVQYMKNIMSKIEVAYRSRKKQKYAGQNFVCLYPSDLVPSHSDLSELVLACNSLAAYQAHAAYTHLERITCAGWEQFVGYVKAFLLFGEKQYDEAFKICWTLWKTRQTAEKWVVSKLSHIIGCCLFKKCCYGFALRWFQKSVNSDSTAGLLSLWNIACTFHCLGKDDASLKTLEHLAQNLPHSIHFNIYLSDIFIEACYAFLLAGRYEDCLEASSLASSDDFYFSIRLRKQSKTLFSSNDVRKVQKSSHFECNVNKSLPTAGPLDVFLLGHNSMHLSETDVKQSSLLHCGNENDEVPINSEFPKANTGEKIQCSHEHVRSHKLIHIMHLLIEASAKYSLKCNDESYNILCRALDFISHFVDRKKTAEGGVSFKEKNPVGNLSEGSCTICSNCATSLVSQVYNNLAIIALSRNHIKEAAYNLTLALISDSGNIDAIYNNCLLQIMLGQVDAAQTFWEKSKSNCGKLKSILTSDDCCDSICTVTVASLKSLNEDFSSVT